MLIDDDDIRAPEFRLVRSRSRARQLHSHRVDPIPESWTDDPWLSLTVAIWTVMALRRGWRPNPAGYLPQSDQAIGFIRNHIRREAQEPEFNLIMSEEVELID